MQTSDLIKALASGLEPVAAGTTRRRLRRAILLSLPLAVAGMWVGLGINPELAEAVRNPLWWVKAGFPLLCAVLTLGLVERLARPGAALGRAPVDLGVALIALWCLAALAVLRTPPDTRTTMLFGDTWLLCPFVVLSLSLPTLAALLIALRQLAPTRPGAAGAAAGLLAGGVGAFVYAWHCPELSLPFVAIWYVAGIALTMLAGALLGPRVLRW